MGRGGDWAGARVSAKVFQSAEECASYVPSFLNDAARAMYYGYTGHGGNRWAGMPEHYTSIAQWREHIGNELTHGWPEGAKLIQRARAEVVGTLKAPLPTRLRSTSGHVVGHSPNVSRALAGHPDVFNRWERAARPAAVRIYVSMCVPGSVPAAQLVWRGVAALILADLYEANGYRVEIWAGMANDERDSFCLIKAAEAPTIPDYLAATLISPRFYRAAMLLGPQSEVTSSAGLGHARPLTAEGIENAGLGAPTVIIDAYTLSKDAAVRVVNETIEKLSAEQEGR